MGMPCSYCKKDIVLNASSKIKLRGRAKVCPCCGGILEGATQKEKEQSAKLLLKDEGEVHRINRSVSA
jgi:hypothetical protein